MRRASRSPSPLRRRLLLVPFSDGRRCLLLSMNELYKIDLGGNLQGRISSAFLNGSCVLQRSVHRDHTTKQGRRSTQSSNHGHLVGRKDHCPLRKTRTRTAMSHHHYHHHHHHSTVTGSHTCNMQELSIQFTLLLRMRLGQRQNILQSINWRRSCHATEAKQQQLRPGGRGSHD